ncbi:MAG: zinc ribbon domain-containing protein [Anaerolineae bacterium]|nr:zinc ribbon domain-containing protein [Anaerolineae bacterium]
MSKVISPSCPACGAPIAPNAQQCPYCQRYVIIETEISAPQVGEEGHAGDRLFQRLAEPRERAFTLSVPHGWLLEGGIVRADFTRQIVNAQFIEAKIDFTVKKDAQGTIAIRWCPEVKYCDMRYSMVGAMFPFGSNYQGMIVMPVMSAADFLVRVAFPWAHPSASAVQLVEQRSEPLLVEAYRQRVATTGVSANFGYDGAAVRYTYSENGRRFEEKAFTVIESMGALAAGMWSNKDTFLMRAPEGQLDATEPLLYHIRESVKLDHAWIAREIASQEMLSGHFLNAQQAEQARNRRALEIQQHLQQVDREITEHRARTHAEIRNDAYLTMTNQEEYINPHTGKVDTGSNQWRHRWVTGGGEEFYTDHEDDDPNITGLFNRSDWKRTPVRPRFPGG